jgi:DNA mismatch repair protein MutS
MTQELLEKKLTPMMEQWSRCKETAKDALLLFRMGDFYEAFYEDAEIVARELDLTLTKRQEIPMSGVPCHASEAYIDRLVAKGYRIAIAEQTEDPKAVKGLVKREVTRFVTPGTTFSSSFLSDKSNNYIACLAQVGSVSGMSVLDITTGEFKAMECENDKELANEIFRLRPSEFLVTAKFKDKQASLFKEMEIAFSPLVTACDEWSFEHRTASTFLAKHFQVHHLDGFGLKGMIAAINASGALLYYIHEILSFSISHIKTLKPYFIGDSLSLDRSTARHLEIMDSAQGEKKQTLFWIMDRTATPMGGRCLKRWMQQPLLSVKEISKRQEAVEALISHPQQLAKLHQILQEVRDVERLIMKLNSGYVVPRDLLMLRQSLEVLPSIKQIIQAIPSEKIFELSLSCCDFHSLVTLLKRSFQDELPLRINEGNLFKEGYRSDLDELRSIMRNGKEWMARYQHRIREETGIKNLKVSYNKIF